MLMPLAGLVEKWGFDLSGGVLHVGAHLVEEAPLYSELAANGHPGADRVTWIEANAAVLPAIRQTLQQYPGQSVIEALVYSEDDVELDFNVTNYQGMSSSIYEFGSHSQFSPDTVFVERRKLRTRTIDSLAAEHGFSASFASLDIQGAELEALKGAVKFLAGVQSMVLEVNDRYVYKGCGLVGQLDELLGDHGFRRVETYWVGGEGPKGQGWGDAAYRKADL